jgi:hypothetical protein
VAGKGFLCCPVKKYPELFYFQTIILNMLLKKFATGYPITRQFPVK